MDGWVDGGGCRDRGLDWGMDRFREKRNKLIFLRLGFCGTWNKNKSENTFLINSKWIHIEYIPEDALALAIHHVYESVVWDHINKLRA